MNSTTTPFEYSVLVCYTMFLVSVLFILMEDYRATNISVVCLLLSIVSSIFLFVFGYNNIPSYNLNLVHDNAIEMTCKRFTPDDVFNCVGGDSNVPLADVNRFRFDNELVGDDLEVVCKRGSVSSWDFLCDVND